MSNLEQITNSLEKKLNRREKRKNQKMRVSGKSVINLKKIITTKKV